MIVCEKCTKENQDHYKFCLGCGAELPKKDGPKPFGARTPAHGLKAKAASAAPPAAAGAVAAAPVAAAPAPVVPAPVVAPAPVAAPITAAVPSAAAPATAPAPYGAASDIVLCPQCNHSNPTSNRFCAACGYNLAALKPAASAPTASSPTGSSPSAAQPAASGAVRPIVMVALRADGSEAGRFEPPAQPTVTIGRDTGSIFAGDSYLSPRHALITRTGPQVVVKDAGSLNGVYLKLKPQAPWPLEFGDVFRIGQEIIRFEDLKMLPPAADGVKRLGSPARGYIGRLALVIGRDTTGNAFPIPEHGVHCGRERGDILFSDDGYVSGLHCRIARESDGRIYLTDVGSSNGTFIRLRAERVLGSGDILLMGQQLFRIDY